MSRHTIVKCDACQCVLRDDEHGKHSIRLETDGHSTIIGWTDMCEPCFRCAAPPVLLKRFDEMRVKQEHETTAAQFAGSS